MGNMRMDFKDLGTLKWLALNANKVLLLKSIPTTLTSIEFNVSQYF